MAGEMTHKGPDPERELVRRALPFGPPAVVVALAGGAAAGGWSIGWSAAIGIAVVFANFTANGLLLAWAADVSLVMLFGAATIGFVIRLGAIVALMFLLNRFAFFSPLAFGLAVVPATILLLVYEMRLLAAGVGRDLILPESTEPAGI
jgi:hypothetical protein